MLLWNQFDDTTRRNMACLHRQKKQRLSGHEGAKKFRVLKQAGNAHSFDGPIYQDAAFTFDLEAETVVRLV